MVPWPGLGDVTGDAVGVGVGVGVGVRVDDGDGDEDINGTGELIAVSAEDEGWDDDGNAAN